MCRCDLYNQGRSARYDSTDLYLINGRVGLWSVSHKQNSQSGHIQRSINKDIHSLKWNASQQVVQRGTVNI